ncbi:hypothetical protein [Secundilactobacillus yichangensis]|uniref:hypothetical protein n=1 Tax=Secundilactobacillus yichangensis TaxID=2799580 RepID=UPI001940709D|nr:hypothetical protein [Secundilactobacillus yichangensis]
MYYLMTITAVHCETPNLSLPPSKKKYRIEIHAVSQETIDNPQRLLDIPVSSVPEWVWKVGSVELDKEERAHDHWAGEIVMRMTIIELRDQQHADWLIERLNEEYMVVN